MVGQATSSRLTDRCVYFDHQHRVPEGSPYVVGITMFRQTSTEFMPSQSLYSPLAMEGKKEPRTLLEFCGCGTKGEVS